MKNLLKNRKGVTGIEYIGIVGVFAVPLLLALTVGSEAMFSTADEDSDGYSDGAAPFAFELMIEQIDNAKDASTVAEEPAV